MKDLKKLYRTAVAEQFPEVIKVTIGGDEVCYRKKTWPDGGASVGLRYGENPHQPGAFYAPDGAPGVIGSLTWRKLGKGGPSWINVADMDHALRILRFFDRPAAAIMKHLNPSGVAVVTRDETLADAVRAARLSDERASFGGVVAVNRPIDGVVAAEILKNFVEAVVAPGYTPEALEAFGAKKDLRVAEIPGLERLPRYVGDPAPLDLKVLADGSLLLQQPFLTRIRTTADFHVHPEATSPEGTIRGERAPSRDQLEDLRTAWYVNTGVRSNGVVFVRDGKTLAIGTGEQERVGAVEQAITKAREKGHDLAGAVVSSDAFFPFRDAVDAFARAGVKAVVQPGGSLRDTEVLAACNEHGIAMVFTGERCFGHF